MGLWNSPGHKVSHTHTEATHTHSLCLHPDHKIIATDEGREQCFCAVFARHRFPLQSPAMSLGERGPIEKRTGYKMLLVRAHQCCVFPAEWLVSEGWRWALCER